MHTVGLLSYMAVYTPVWCAAPRVFAPKYHDTTFRNQLDAAYPQIEARHEHVACAAVVHTYHVVRTYEYTLALEDAERCAGSGSQFCTVILIIDPSYMTP